MTIKVTCWQQPSMLATQADAQLFKAYNRCFGKAQNFKPGVHSSGLQKEKTCCNGSSVELMSLLPKVQKGSMTSQPVWHILHTEADAGTHA